MRDVIIAGNWKMYKTESEAVDFITTLAPMVENCGVKIFLAVPFTAISAAVKAAKNTSIVIGAQNMNDAEKGAFTGEIAALMLKSAGAEFVILGHSERRTLFGENDGVINKKVLRALKDDLRPILCVGETEKERTENQTEEVLKRQIFRGLEKVSSVDAEKIVLAYEPVWAIGTGKTATPEMAQNAHHFIRNCLKELFDGKISSRMCILYGGSVKGDNIAEIRKGADIDGALVGGASLDPKTFFEIIKKSR